MKRQLNIKAILDSDMEKILDQLNMLEFIDAGKIKCGFCKQKINRGNIEGIYVQNGEVRFCCNKIECYEKLVRFQIKEGNV